eukprot:TRINITY_DN4805_c0_g1_i3.p3 TRINITY_DN4805_c0_g1~~TRINITY_DN4805_c0_g1_i3.p3  ORF type:complete len:204 (-),score=13.53 TRINITY_DN4805_c0_g1_i3:314-925(-)
MSLLTNNHLKLRPRNVVRVQFSRGRGVRQFRSRNKLVTQYQAFDDLFDQNFQQQFQRQFQDMQRMQEKLEQQFDKQQQQLEREFQRESTGSSRLKYQYESRESTGMYSRYERVQIVQGGAPFYQATIVPQQQSLSPLLVVALIIGGIYAVATTFLAVNYERTPYSEQKKWQVLALWPALATLSREFREKMAVALFNQKPKSNR